MAIFFASVRVHWYDYLEKLEDGSYSVYALLLGLGLLQIVGFLSYAEPFPALTDALVDLWLWQIRDFLLHNLVHIKVV